MKKIVVFLCLFAFFLSLFPIYPISSQEEVPVPYIYEAIPKNSFGINEPKKLVNETYFWELMNQKVKWRLEGQHPTTHEWIIDNTAMQVEINQYDYYQKVTLNFTSPFTTHYRFTFAIELDSIDYVNRSDYEIGLNLSIPNTDEVYYVVYNWSDIKPLIDNNKLTISHGRITHNEQRWFWFRMQTVNEIPSGTNFVIDPYFGYSSVGTYSQLIEDKIAGGKYTCSENGIAKNITARVLNAGGHIKCGLYYWSNKTFIASTEEKSWSAPPRWETFNFSSDIPLKEGTEYLLVVWSDDPEARIFYAIGTSTNYNHEKTYNASFPTTYSITTSTANRNRSMYCSYDTIATVSSPYPTNNSRANKLFPQLEVNVTGGSLFNVTFASNYSGSWINYQTNASVSSGIYRYEFTGASVPSATYWWKVYVDNGMTNISNIYNFYVPQNVSTNSTVSVEESTADLKGYLFSAENCTNYGFWYHTSPITPGVGTNVTVGSNPSSPTAYTKSIASLSKGQYYYVKAWQKFNNYFANDSSSQYFLTKPDSPSSVAVADYNATNITLSWTNGTHAVSNYSTIIRYSTLSYPSSIDGGTGGANVTGTSHKFVGLDEDEEYYFSLWSYINESGSPSLHRYSDFPSYASLTLSSGNFNLSVRYENTSHGLVDLTSGLQHQIVIHYSNYTEYIYFNNTGEVDIPLSTATINVTATDEENGTIVFYKTSIIRMLEFYWNWTDDKDFSILQHYDTTAITNPAINSWVSLANTPLTEYNLDIEVFNSSIYGGWILVPSTKWTYHSSNDTVEIDSSFLDANSTMVRVTYWYTTSTPYRCRRIIVPQNQSADTIYILDSKKIYGLTTGSGDTMLDALIDYTYNIEDYAGTFFDPENNPYLIVYTTDRNGTIRVIHSEYFDISLQIHPQLLFHKLYRVGVRSDIDSNDFIAFAPTDTDMSPAIIIPHESISYYTYSDLINYSMGWTATSFYFNYADSTYSTINASFMMYYWLNQTFASGSTEYTENDIHNFSYTVGEGLNTSASYLLIVSTSINTLNDASEINDDFTGTYTTMFIIYPGSHNFTQVNASDIDTLMENLFGQSPVYSWENENRYVPWSYLGMFGLCLFVGSTFSKKNGWLGMLAVGLIMLIFPFIIYGVASLYGYTYGYAEISLSIVGGILCGSGIIGLLGGVDMK